jgi:hypothetical protein
MWPLGLEAGGFRFIERLMPGFNNVTTRIRYYSFFSWVFWTFQQRAERGEAVPTAAAQKAWRERLEMAFRLASLYRAPGMSGLVGNRKVQPPTAAPDAPLSLRDPGAATAFQPANYSSSFALLRCGASGEGGLIVLSDEVGIPLARAFDAQLRADPGGRAAFDWLVSDHEEIPAGVLYQAAEALALRDITVSEPEHAPLIDVLFRMRDAADPARNSTDTSRSRSMGLLLQLVRDADGTFRGPNDIHGIFATRRFSSGALFEPRAAFRTSFAGWERYQERQQQKVAIYGFWSVLVSLLHEGLSLPDRLVRRIQEYVSTSAVAKRWLGEAPLEWTVKDAQEWLVQQADDTGDGIGDSLDALAETILSAETSPAERAGAATVLLLLVTAHWSRAEPGMAAALARMHRDSAPERLPLASVTRQVESRGAQDLGRFIGWAVASYVLAQANQTAIRKLAERGDYHFFISQDAAGYRVRSGLSSMSYVNYDIPRVGSALALMAGLGLVEAGDHYGITSAGEALLRRLVEYHSGAS